MVKKKRRLTHGPSPSEVNEVGNRNVIYPESGIYHKIFSGQNQRATLVTYQLRQGRPPTSSSSHWSQSHWTHAQHYPLRCQGWTLAHQLDCFALHRLHRPQQGFRAHVPIPDAFLLEVIEIHPYLEEPLKRGPSVSLCSSRTGEDVEREEGDPAENFSVLFGETFLCIPTPLIKLMERLENLQRDYLRLTERVRVSLQIHVGDAAAYRRLQTDVLDYLNAARQVSDL